MKRMLEDPDPIIRVLGVCCVLEPAKAFALNTSFMADDPGRVMIGPLADGTYREVTVGDIYKSIRAGRSFIVYDSDIWTGTLRQDG